MDDFDLVTSQGLTWKNLSPTENALIQDPDVPENKEQVKLEFLCSPRWSRKFYPSQHAIDAKVEKWLKSYILTGSKSERFGKCKVEISLTQISWESVENRKDFKHRVNLRNLNLAQVYHENTENIHMTFHTLARGIGSKLDFKGGVAVMVGFRHNPSTNEDYLIAWCFRCPNELQALNFLSTLDRALRERKRREDTKGLWADPFRPVIVPNGDAVRQQSKGSLTVGDSEIQREGVSGDSFTRADLRFIEELGGGNFGNVHKAKLRGKGIVAVKVLKVPAVFLEETDSDERQMLRIKNTLYAVLHSHRAQMRDPADDSKNATNPPSGFEIAASVYPVNFRKLWASYVARNREIEFTKKPLNEEDLFQLLWDDLDRVRFVGHRGAGFILNCNETRNQIDAREYNSHQKSFKREAAILESLCSGAEDSLKYVAGMEVYFPPRNEDPQLLVLDYVQYGNLESVLHQATKSLRSKDRQKDFAELRVHLVACAHQIAEGMKYLHEKQICHFDLACRNILVAEQHRPGVQEGVTLLKVSDFGIAIKAGDDGSVRKYSGHKVDFTITAPEYFSSDPSVTLQADVYSYGVILWTMMTAGVTRAETEDRRKGAFALPRRWTKHDFMSAKQDQSDDIDHTEIRKLFTQGLRDEKKELGSEKCKFGFWHLRKAKNESVLSATCGATERESEPLKPNSKIGALGYVIRRNMDMEAAWLQSLEEKTPWGVTNRRNLLTKQSLALLEVAWACWNKNPEERPSFSALAENKLSGHSRSAARFLNDQFAPSDDVKESKAVKLPPARVSACQNLGKFVFNKAATDVGVSSTAVR